MGHERCRHEQPEGLLPSDPRDLLDSNGSQRDRSARGPDSGELRSLASVMLLPAALNQEVCGNSGLFVATRARQW